MRQRLQKISGALRVADHSVELVRTRAAFEMMQFHLHTNNRLAASPEYRQSTDRAQRVFGRRHRFSTCPDCIKFLHQCAKESPEVILTRVTANAADFLAIVDQYKHRGDPFDFNEGQVRRNRVIDAHAAQGCAPAFFCFRIDGSDLAIESLAPGATSLFEHYELSGTDASKA